MTEKMQKKCGKKNTVINPFLVTYNILPYVKTKSVKNICCLAKQWRSVSVYNGS